MPDIYLETKELMEMRQAMMADDIPEEAIRDTLLANAEEFEAKGVALYQSADEIDYEIKMLEEAISALEGRKSQAKSRKEKMRSILLEAMITTGVTQIKCPFFTISTAKGSLSTVIDDERSLPDEYVETVVVNKPDKKAIGAAIDSGKEVPGARRVRGEARLVVRK